MPPVDPGGGSSGNPEQAVVDYYRVVSSGDLSASWSRLSPAYQRQVGGFGRYEAFWDGFDRVDVTNVEPQGDRAVRATLRFVPNNGSAATTEDRRLRFVTDASGSLLIDDYD